MTITSHRQQDPSQARFASFVRTQEYLSVHRDKKEVTKSLAPADAAGFDLYRASGDVGNAHGATIQAALEAYTHEDFFFDLSSFTVNYEFSRHCPPSWAPGHKFIVLDHFGSTFLIGTNSPRNPGLIHALRRKLTEKGLAGDREPHLQFVRVSAADLDFHTQRILTASGSSIGQMTQDLSGLGKGSKAAQIAAAEEIYTLDQLVEEQTKAAKSDPDKFLELVMKVILAKAYSPDEATRRASDVHISPGPPDGDFTVRYRVGGQLESQGGSSMSVYPQLATAIKGMCSPMDMAKRGYQQDGRYTMRLRTGIGETAKLDCRVVCIPHGPEPGGNALESFVFRILDSSARRPSLNTLVAGDARLERLLREFIDLPDGIVLVTGPTGSGKSTTLSSMLLEIAQDPAWSIDTIEDPIEYEYSNDGVQIHQTQVDASRDITMASALRYFLRFDPDVIMVGEMRDYETASLGITAAVTGHQLFSTLHTNDAPSAVVRLIDMGVPYYMVAETVKGVIAQRMARRLCDGCKHPYVLNDASKASLPEAFWAGTYYERVGCSVCGGTGYRGRIAILDILKVDDVVRNLIHGFGRPDAGNIVDKIREHNEKTHSPGLFHRGMEMARLGLVDIPQALAVRHMTKTD